MYFTSLPPSLFLYLSKSSEDHLCMFFLLILHVFELISLSFCSLSFFFLITRSFNFCLDFWVLSFEFSDFYLKQEQWVLLLFQFSIHLASSSFMFSFGVFFVFESSLVFCFCELLFYAVWLLRKYRGRASCFSTNLYFGMEFSLMLLGMRRKYWKKKIWKSWSYSIKQQWHVLDMSTRLHRTIFGLTSPDLCFISLAVSLI